MLLLIKAGLVVLLLGATRDSQTDAASIGDELEEDGDNANIRLKRDTNAMLNFLSKYGYLPKDVQGDKLYSEETITIAIKEFQEFSGLRVTGILDQATVNKMGARRCGLPDILHSDSPNSNKPFAYTTMGTRWLKNTLTWMPTKLSNKLRESDQLAAIQKAFSAWAAVTPLSFQRTRYEPDIEIKFASREHGDGEHNKFDGKGGVLAHAFGPGANLGGDTHFDDDEFWTIGNEQGTDLIQVAAHEFGHSLGLAHSRVPGALMAPYYVYSDKLILSEDDIQGIQAIYGPNRRPQPKVDTSLATLPPVTSTVTTSTTTTSTSTRRTTNGNILDYCKDNFHLDAIFQDQREQLYAFRNDLVYKFNRQGLELGYPKLISHVFPRAPKKAITAATFVPETGKTYIFKGSQVWRFTNFSLDQTYPKIWTNDRNSILSATLTLTYRGRSQIFMFGNNHFLEWNHHTEKLVPGEPLAMQTYFPHAPNMPDAAFLNQQGHFFFFKGNSYKKLEHRGRNSDFKPLAQNLFGSVCGGHPELLDLIKQHSPNSREVKGLSDVPLPEPKFSPMILNLINRQ
jgi:matrix metalloproteinase-14 (membrane-inserted)